MKKLFLIGGLSVVLLSGCSKAHDAVLKQDIATAQKHWTVEKWWQAFHDPLLNRFADQILEQNLDIQITAARMTAARAATAAIASGLYPDISLSGSESRSKNQFYRTPQTLALGGANLNWELDFFGQTRAAVKGSYARAQAAALSVDDARHAVVADLAKAMIDWRQARDTAQQTHDLLKAEDEQVHLLDERAKAGLIDASFVERAKAQRAQTATQLPLAEAAKQAAQYQIERLLGVDDRRVAKALRKAKPCVLIIPKPDKLFRISVDVIKNRPDVRQAHFALLAAQADLKLAEANLWPQISLANFFGVAHGSSGTNLGSNPLWTVSASLAAPLINFGRLSGMIDARHAEAQAMALNYQNTISRALQETKTALSDYLNGLNAVAAQAEALKRRRGTVHIARERFQRGLTDMTDLTTAQTELDEATLALIADKTFASEAYIRFQKALSIGV